MSTAAPPPRPNDRLQAVIAAAGLRVPAWLDPLLRAATRPEDFDAGVILSSSGRHRLYVSDRGDPAAWERLVRSRWPGAGRLLDAAPPGVRRMLDTDGDPSPDGLTEIYLDDLQERRPDLGLMCLLWSSRWPGLARIRPVQQPPAHFAQAAGLQGEGKLALRTGSGPTHLLWVTEARWTGRHRAVLARARAARSLPDAWEAVADAVPGIYIDAVDLHRDGTTDLTVGLLPA